MRRERKFGGSSFADHGLAGPPVRCRSRTLHVTVDFEAFTPGMIDLWANAMTYWAQRASELALPCTFFISLEDAACLKADSDGAYAALLGGLNELQARGSSLHPHNHRLFDVDSGRQVTPAGALKQAPGYSKQASMFYDVVHRNGVSLAEWLPQLLLAYRSLHVDAELSVPDRIVFRPGGWDCGSTAEEQRSYLAAIHDAGISLHSGDTHGTYGTRSYGLHSRFGQNVYPLTGGIVELAPCWALNLGQPRHTPPFAASVARLLGQPLWRGIRDPGAFVVVLHFDHLFHSGWRNTFQAFSVRSPTEVRKRIDRNLGLLARLARVLKLRPTLLEETDIPSLAQAAPESQPRLDPAVGADIASMPSRSFP